MKKFLINAFVVSSVCLVASVQAANKFSLGNVHLSDEGHVAYLPLGVCTRVDEIRIKTDKKITINEVMVNFKMGRDKVYRLHKTIEKEGKTDWLELGGYTRCVQGVSIYGKAKKKQANIEILGKIK